MSQKVYVWTFLGTALLRPAPLFNTITGMYYPCCRSSSSFALFRKGLKSSNVGIFIETWVDCICCCSTISSVCCGEYLLIVVVCTWWVGCSRELTVQEPGDADVIRLYYLTGGNGKEIRNLSRFL
jgi:hypothetical protein